MTQPTDMDTESDSEAHSEMVYVPVGYDGYAPQGFQANGVVRTGTTIVQRHHHASTGSQLPQKPSEHSIPAATKGECVTFPSCGLSLNLAAPGTDPCVVSPVTMRKPMPQWNVAPPFQAVNETIPFQYLTSYWHNGHC